MSQMALNVLVGTAQISRGFRERLLNGNRPDVLAEFDLTDEERDFLLGIEVDSVQEFAVRLDEWLQTQSSPPTLDSRSTSQHYNHRQRTVEYCCPE